MTENLDFLRSRRKFYILMRENKYSEACEFLSENPSAIDEMKVSELTDFYKTFYSHLPIERLGALNKILKERIFGQN